jgi:hypothetical protein
VFEQPNVRNQYAVKWDLIDLAHGN